MDFLSFLISLNDSMVNFSLFRGFYLRFNEELLNGYDFLIEESKVRIFLIEHLVH